MVRPPGTILQHMHFEERLSRVVPGRFVEIGVGEGAISELLLETVWTRTGYELNERTMEMAASVNRRHVEQGRYVSKNEDWLNAPRDTSKKARLLAIGDCCAPGSLLTPFCAG
ncbi:MAG: hypothetical protein OES09_12700 [Gammaproteobacteria bacterium]|nr:hypothetical protein [Gammaproteobacteria bacterium]